jgi:putative ABC transport system permease protein
MHSLRFLKRNKGYVIINLIGFAIGLAACLMMISYLKYQSGFDSFHSNKDRIYRGLAVIQLAGKDNTTIHMPGYLADFAVQEVPGVESAIRLNSNLRYEIHCGIKKYTDQKLFYTDPAFFTIFSFRLLQGKPSEVLNAPFSIVLTKQTARKFFGEMDPVGQSLDIGNQLYQVTGVLEDLPENSHITFDLLASLSSLTRPDYNVLDREGFTFPTYFLLKEGVDPSTVLPQLNIVFDKVVKQRYGNAGITGDFSFQPLSEIHTTQLQATDYAITTSKSTLILFTAMAIFILLVGVVNFVNLTTALYERRSKEIGIKKVIGATRTQLFWQTMKETSLLVLGALLIALLFCEIIDGLVEKNWALHLPLFYKNDLISLFLLITGTAVVAFFASAYPNWYLSRMTPGTMLKQESLGRSKRFSVSKILVLIQYGLSVFIICLMFLFSAQLKHVSKADLGFDSKDVIVYEHLTDHILSSYPFLKDKLTDLPFVRNVTASFSIPGKYRIANSVIYKYGGSESDGILININRVQQDYLETYGIKLVQGEDFSKLHQLDSSSFLINEEAAEKLGLVNPIGQELVLRGVKGKIIGVVRNFRTKPLYSDFDKEILTMQTDQFNFLTVRLKPGFTLLDLRTMESAITEIDPGYQPTSFFIEDMYKEFYQREQNQIQLIFSAAIVGIVLSIMGLMSLMVLSLQKQRKEIGIRKVFGANGESVFFLLISRTLIWVALSNLIAWPLAYIVTNNWLERFAYRIRVIDEWPSFIFAGFIVVLLTFLAISIQSISVARMSPSEIIRKG